MTVYVMPPRAITQPAAELDVTTHGSTFRTLSPMLLGPVPLYAGMWSRTMENAWQFAKVYPAHTTGLKPGYLEWARAGLGQPPRGPVPDGQGAKPLYSCGPGSAGRHRPPAADLHPAVCPGRPVHQLDLFTLLRGTG